MFNFPQQLRSGWHLKKDAPLCNHDLFIFPHPFLYYGVGGRHATVAWLKQTYGPEFFLKPFLQRMKT